MKIYTTLLLAAAALLATLAAPAQATLMTIGTATYDSSSYNLIYDNDSPFGSIIYLDYTNAGAYWADQTAWAVGLNGVGILSYNLDPGYSVTWGGDWRLPGTVDGIFDYGFDGTTTAGFNITSSELGHLYYSELGNSGLYDSSGNPQGGAGLINSGPFVNLQTGWYWSGTEYTAFPNLAWAFIPSTGSQSYSSKDYFEFLGLAVRSGEVVEVAPVPEPSTLLLLGSSLLGFVWYGRKRNQA